MIDLHSHTNESDGTFTPEELVAAGKKIGLSALAITDHDTFLGYQKAIPFAESAGLDLVRGIELNSRLDKDGRSSRWAHVLGYFPFAAPRTEFLTSLKEQQLARRDRNARLAASLQTQASRSPWKRSRSEAEVLPDVRTSREC